MPYLAFAAANKCKIRHKDDREFHTLSEYILTLVIACSYIKNKLEKINENKQKKIFLESDDEGVFIVF